MCQRASILFPPGTEASTDYRTGSFGANFSWLPQNVVGFRHPRDRFSTALSASVAARA